VPVLYFCKRSNEPWREGIAANVAKLPNQIHATQVALMGSGRWLVCIIFYAEPRVADMGQALLKCC
jgi:hypothetical protein